jgi:hypothetical protein
MMRRRESALAAMSPLAARGAASYATEYDDMLVRHLTAEVNRHTARWDAERARGTCIFLGVAERFYAAAGNVRVD